MQNGTAALENMWTAFYFFIIIIFLFQLFTNGPDYKNNPGRYLSLSF